MKQVARGLVAVFVAVALCAIGASESLGQFTPTPTNTYTSTPTSTPTQTPTQTHTPTPTDTPVFDAQHAFQSSLNGSPTPSPVAFGTPSNVMFTTGATDSFSQWKELKGSTLVFWENTADAGIELYCKGDNNQNNLGTLVTLVKIDDGTIVTEAVESGTYRFDGLINSGAQAAASGTPTVPDRSIEKYCRIKLTTCDTCKFVAYLPPD